MVALIGPPKMVLNFVSLCLNSVLYNVLNKNTVFVFGKSNKKMLPQVTWARNREKDASFD